MKGRIVQMSVSPGGVPKPAVAAARVGALAAEGHATGPGALSENVTVEGLDWSAVLLGSRPLLSDSVLLEVTRYSSPCANIAPVFHDRDYSRVAQKRHPGSSRIYARVLAGGTIRAGDPVRLRAPAAAARPGATAPE